MNKKPLLFSLLLLFAGNRLSAQAGVLDATFGNAGIVITTTPTFNEAYSVAVQPDGKIVAGGYTGNYGSEDFALLRYLPNGTLDPLFGTGGKVSTTISAGTDRGQAVLLQPDGKIILAGYGQSGSATVIVVVRYLSNGSLDSTFGTQGEVLTPVGNGLDYGYCAALQPDGKIIVAGYSANGFNGDIALVRYNPNGTLDPSFGTGGIVAADIAGDFDLAFSVLLQPDGKIVTAGYSNDGTKYNFGLVRFNSDGSYDTTFGTGGKVMTSIGPSEDVASSAVLQPDGKIILAGYTWNAGFTDTDMALARYTTNGSLDSGFGTNGIFIGPFNTTYDYLTAVDLQPDGKIVAATQFDGAPNINFAMSRFNTNGTFDTSFNSTGMLITDVGGNENDYPTAIAMQPDGKIISAGAVVINSAQDVDVAIVRYLSGLDVGIVDFPAGATDLLVYPNPVKEDAVLEYTLPEKETLSIELRDMQGKCISVLQPTQQQEAGHHRQVLQLPPSLASGTYLLVLASADGSVEIRLVK